MLQYLRDIDIFFDLAEDALLSVSKTVHLISPQRGEFVFSEGDVAESFYIVVSGYYRLIQHGENGQEIVVAVFGSGDPIGLAAVLQYGTYPSSVEVLEDGQLLRFTVYDMEEILNQHPMVMKRVLIAVHERLCESHQRIRELCTKPVEQRLADTLIRLIHKAGILGNDGSVQLNLRLRRRDLAQLCGSTVETVSRTLKMWERHTIIESGRERVDIININQLQAISEGRLVLC